MKLWIKRNFFGVNAALGLALGSGYMTSLRFLGPVGVSEIAFALILIKLILKYPFVLWRYGSGLQAFFKAYFLFSFFIVMPALTILSWYYGLDGSDPIYVLSYFMGILLVFLIVEGIRDNYINVRIFSLWFAFVFLISNVIYIAFFSAETSTRESSLSNNPNQLLFYLVSLGLLLSMYSKKFLVISAAPILYIGFKSGSDAFLLCVFVVVFVYTYLKILYVHRFSVIANFVFHLLILMVSVFVVSFLYGEKIVAIWVASDEGGSRAALMWNSLMASLQSPLFGWGAGSFSGKEDPFEGYEAHNTYLDLAMQFGFFVPLAIYGLIIASIIISYRERKFLVVSFIMAFLVSGVFHFSGRHFVFWVEVAVFWTYVFSNAHRSKSKFNSPKGICKKCVV